MSVYSTDLTELGWYVLEVTATLDVIDNLGDLNPANNAVDDPDVIFLNSFLYDTSGNKIYAKESPPPGFVYASSFNITLGVIEVNTTSVLDANTAPYILPKPSTTLKMIAGKAWTHSFGNAFDWEGNDITVTMDLRNAVNFFTFDKDTMTLSVPAGVTDV